MFSHGSVYYALQCLLIYLLLQAPVFNGRVKQLLCSYSKKNCSILLDLFLLQYLLSNIITLIHPENLKKLSSKFHTFVLFWYFFRSGYFFATFFLVFSVKRHNKFIILTNVSLKKKKKSKKGMPKATTLPKKERN